MTTHTARHITREARRARKAIRHQMRRAAVTAPGDTRQHCDRARHRVARAYKDARPEMFTTVEGAR